MEGWITFLRQPDATGSDGSRMICLEGKGGATVEFIRGRIETELRHVEVVATAGEMPGAIFVARVDIDGQASFSRDFPLAGQLQWVEMPRWTIAYRATDVSKR